MKLGSVLLLSLAAAFVIIGISEMMIRGVSNGYWAVMLSMIFFFLYLYQKGK